MLRVVSLAILVACLAAPVFAAPPLEAYGKLPAVEHMTLSPAGGRFAFIGVNGDQRKLYVATTDGKPLLQAATGTAKVMGLEWAGEDHLLVITSATVPLVGFVVERAELETVVSINLQTKKSVVLFSDGDKFLPAAFGNHGVAEIGGRWYGFFGGVTREKGGYQAINNEGYPDLFRVDLDTGDAVKVAGGSQTEDDWLVDPTTGDVLARANYDQSSGAWQVFSGAIGGKLLASGRGKYGGAGVYRGRSKDTVLIDEPRDDGGSSLQEVSLSGTPAGAPIDGDTIAGLEFDRLTHLWTGIVTPGDRPQLTMFSPDLEAKVQSVLRAFPNQTVDFTSDNADFTRMIVFTTGRRLRDLLAGRHDDRPRRLGYDYPDVGPDDVGPIGCSTGKPPTAWRCTAC